MIAKKKALCALSLVIISAVMLFSGCAGIPSALAIEGLMSLDEAFDVVAAELEANITAGYEVSVYKITASREEIGNFLADNLSDRLAARKKLIPLAREDALRYAETEHQFQMSGLVSDDSAVGIGHYLGAKVVITGDFLITADFSQLRVRAVDVGNSAILGASPIVLINNNDPILKNLMASFGIIPTSRVNENALAHLNRGKDLYMEDKLDAAIVEFGKALAIDKKLFEAYSYRGSSFYEKDDYDKAIADFTQAIRLDPDYIEAYINRGVSYYNKGDPDRAVADFEAALKINPDDADARYNLDFVRRQRGR